MYAISIIMCMQESRNSQNNFQEPFQESYYAQLPQTSVLAIAIQNLTPGIRSL